MSKKHNKHGRSQNSKSKRANPKPLKKEHFMISLLVQEDSLNDPYKWESPCTFKMQGT